MFLDKATDDSACLNCGYVSYIHPVPAPEPGKRERRRRAWHAGIDLG